jgi:hypothetical protein
MTQLGMLQKMMKENACMSYFTITDPGIQG